MLIPTLRSSHCNLDICRGGKPRRKQALDHERLLSSPVARHTPATSQPGSLPGVLPVRDSEKAYLEEGFPLRCFQQFSQPNIATRRCFVNNRHTRGWSTPVLSY